MRLFLFLCIWELMASGGYTQLHVGIQGPPGRYGPKGPPGEPGMAGPPGAKGISGVIGMKGFRGDVGHPGREGNPGNDGAPGPVVLCGEEFLMSGLQYKRDITNEQYGDPFGSIDHDAETLRKRITKLKMAINYGFVQRVGQRYFVSNKEMGAFSKAFDFCTKKGLELALPKNEEENNVLTQVFKDAHAAAWINVNNGKAGGSFEVDMKNQRLTFTRWGEGQPDKSIQDTGCTMMSENGAWQVTRDCSLNAYIICQL